LMEYLKLMKDLELLEVIRDEKGEPRAYKTTKQGFHYLELYGEIRELLKKEGLFGMTDYQKVRAK